MRQRALSDKEEHGLRQRLNTIRSFVALHALGRTAEEEPGDKKGEEPRRQSRVMGAVAVILFFALLIIAVGAYLAFGRDTDPTASLESQSSVAAGANAATPADASNSQTATAPPSQSQTPTAQSSQSLPQTTQPSQNTPPPHNENDHVEGQISASTAQVGPWLAMIDSSAPVVSGLGDGMVAVCTLLGVMNTGKVPLQTAASDWNLVDGAGKRHPVSGWEVTEVAPGGTYYANAQFVVPVGTPNQFALVFSPVEHGDGQIQYVHPYPMEIDTSH